MVEEDILVQLVVLVVVQLVVWAGVLVEVQRGQQYKVAGAILTKSRVVAR